LALYEYLGWGNKVSFQEWSMQLLWHEVTKWQHDIGGRNKVRDTQGEMGGMTRDATEHIAEYAGIA